MTSPKDNRLWINYDLSLHQSAVGFNEGRREGGRERRTEGRKERGKGMEKQ